MAEFVVTGDLAEQLESIAQREHRPVEDVLRSMVDVYSTMPKNAPADHDPLDDFIGAFDDDITDLSTTVRETMQEYYRKKYGSSD